jgi:RNA polymerase sigma-70 factor (ECF subfamily)
MAYSGSFTDLITQAFVNGDSNAFDTLYWTLHRYIYNYVLNYHDAEDLALASLQKIEQMYGTIRDPDKARSWCFQIAYHMALDHLRRPKISAMSWEDVRNKELVLEHSEVVSLFQATNIDQSPEEYAELRETQELIREVLSYLPEHFRSCLILKFVYELKLEEIADIHRCNRRTISRYILEAREQFQYVYTRLSLQQSAFKRSSGR